MSFRNSSLGSKQRSSNDARTHRRRAEAKLPAAFRKSSRNIAPRELPCTVYSSRLVRHGWMDLMRKGAAKAQPWRSSTTYEVSYLSMQTPAPLSNCREEKNDAATRPCPSPVLQLCAYGIRLPARRLYNGLFPRRLTAFFAESAFDMRNDKTTRFFLCFSYRPI